ncbi:hypothetical protein VBD025_00405 [Virgibacillus flavescens]|uniref:hypothetical protein n=1 Tax=Virgibacillus flavescens TaxID=1611422 RepID=UPI003D351744
MSIPKGEDALYSQSRIVEVNVSKCCDWQGYSYTDYGWHYLCATIKEFINNPNINYKESILSKYYQSFHPKSIQNCLFYGDDEYLQPICNGWPPLPWENTFNLRMGSNQHFGPNSDTFVKEEFFKTINIYKNLASEGYLPDENQDGYIRGHFLKNHYDYRFKLNGGQHRMAALSVLGYKTLQVKLQPDKKRVIDIITVQTWPQILNGKYNKETAVKVFNSYFINNGREKAERLNLIN